MRRVENSLVVFSEEVEVVEASEGVGEGGRKDKGRRALCVGVEWLFNSEASDTESLLSLSVIPVRLDWSPSSDSMLGITKRRQWQRRWQLA